MNDDTLVKVGEKCRLNIHVSDDGLVVSARLSGYDFGGDNLRIIKDRENRVIVKMRGFSFYSGRPSLSVREYAPTEYWAFDRLTEGGHTNVQCVSTIIPGRDRTRLKKWLKEWEGKVNE